MVQLMDIKMLVPIHLFFDRPMVAEKVTGAMGKFRVTAIGYGENEKLAQHDAISKIVANMGIQIGEPETDIQGLNKDSESEPTYKITLISLGRWKVKVVKALADWRKKWRPGMTSNGSILARAKEDIEKGGVIQEGATIKSANELYTALLKAEANVMLTKEDNEED